MPISSNGDVTTSTVAHIAPDQHPTVDAVLSSYWQRDSQRRGDEIEREVRRRYNLRSIVEQSDDHRAAAIAAVRRDRGAFFDDWLWTYDPRNVDRGLPARVPFVLRPKQRECLAWLQESKRLQQGGLIEKSRDEGASFLCLGDMLYDWLFVSGFAGGVGSRKQDLVDRISDPDTLFAKLRMMMEYLPDWMLPKGYNAKEHNNFMRLVNPHTGATITGEAGDNIGRGGRKSWYLVDEWAFVDHAEAINAALSQNTNVRIKVTTPNGPGNPAYTERFASGTRVFTLHWRDNPHKNTSCPAVNTSGKVVRIYPWYEIQRRSPDTSEATLAQEVDIDWTASVEGAVIPAKWVQAAVGLDIGEGQVCASGLDVSEYGGDHTSYAHRRGGKVLHVRHLKGKMHERAARAEQSCRRDHASVLYFDRLGVGAAITATLQGKSLPFRVVGIANSQKPTKAVFEDSPKVPADERFRDRAAEMWWALRLRFERTYQRVHEGASHADDTCISLPNSPELIAQLSQPTYSKNSAGKIVVNKKGNGTRSPDDAEAVMYAFANEVEYKQYGPAFF